VTADTDVPYTFEVLPDAGGLAIQVRPVTGPPEPRGFVVEVSVFSGITPLPR
jgi:hypothetical protein